MLIQFSSSSISSMYSNVTTSTRINILQCTYVHLRLFYLRVILQGFVDPIMQHSLRTSQKWALFLQGVALREIVLGRSVLSPLWRERERERQRDKERERERQRERETERERGERERVKTLCRKIASEKLINFLQKISLLNLLTWTEHLDLLYCLEQNWLLVACGNFVFQCRSTTSFFTRIGVEIENLHNIAQYGNSPESGTLSSHASHPHSELTFYGVTALCSPGEPPFARGRVANGGTGTEPSLSQGRWCWEGTAGEGLTYKRLVYFCLQ